MNVRELIEALEKIEDKELPVYAIDYEYGDTEINNVSLVNDDKSNRIVKKYVFLED